MPAILVNGKIIKFAIEDGAFSSQPLGNKIGYNILNERDGRVLVKIGDMIREIFYSEDGDSIEIYANGGTTSFSVLTDRDLLLRTFENDKAIHQHHSEIKAPMPGLVVNVMVKKGDNVKRGTTLAILEAMKMENEMRAPQDAEVTDVLVKAGDVVEKDQVILMLQ